MANVYYEALDSGDRVSSNTISYHFSDDYFLWNSYEKAQFSIALSQWSNVANIHFVQTANASIADFILHNVDNSVVGSDTLGSFEMPWGGQQQGYFNYEGTGWDYANVNGGLEKGGYGFVTILHEVGHGLGMAHTHDRIGGSGLFPGVDNQFDSGRFGHNQGLYTVMGYNDGRLADNLDPDVTPGYGWSGGPMAFDIHAIQKMYGANNSYRTGNDTYRLPEGNDVGTFYETIWDSGGRDSIVYGGDEESTIDLRAASLRSGDAYAGGRLSSAEGVYGGFTIANGVIIENATGGSARDVMIGNQVRNVIQAGDGNDVVNGLAGNDRLFGNNGDDRLSGAVGIDQLFGQAGNDRLFGAHGNDILVGGNDHDQLFGGAGNDVLRGQSGNDRLVGGGGADRLFAGGGNDVLLGGAGNDLHVFSSGIDMAVFAGRWGFDRIVNFTVGEDLLDLSRVAGLNSVRQLSINDDGADTIVSYGGSGVRLVNVDHNLIDDDDVIL